MLSRHVACQNKQSLSSYYQDLSSPPIPESMQTRERRTCEQDPAALLRSSDIRSLWGAMQAQTPERCQVQSNHLGNAGAGTGYPWINPY